MKIKDYNTLRKLMQQSTSDNDHEALQALRMANAIVKKYGLDWDRIFNRLVTVVNEFEAAPDDEDPDIARKNTAGLINEAFEIVLESDPKGSFLNFINSLQEQWTAKKHLTDAQQAALFKAARSAQEPRR